MNARIDIKKNRDCWREKGYELCDSTCIKIKYITHLAHNKQQPLFR